VFFPPKLKASFCLTLITESKIFLALRNYLYIYRSKRRLRFIGNHRDHDLAVSGNGYGASVAQIELDVLTGEVEILSTDLLYDCGESLSPEIDLGQVEGSFIIGVGHFLTVRCTTK
jgi:CO/xanthine dehydrogenase Mo-binding subunit